MFPLASTKTGSKGAAPAGPTGLTGLAPDLRERIEPVVATIVKSLQTMAGTVTTVEGMVAGLTMGSVRSVIASRTENVVALLDCPDIPCRIFATLDATLVHILVELLCGAQGVEAPSASPRAATAIDQQFAQIVFSLASSAIQTEWADIGFGTVRAAKIEGPTAPDVFGPRINEVGTVDLTIGAFGLHGKLHLALPPVALDRFSGEKGDVREAAPDLDANWSRSLQQELGRAPVVLDAYLDVQDLTLGVLAALRVGQVLALPPTARSRVSLLADDRVLYRGEIGQEDNHYSLRIDEIVEEVASPVPFVTVPRSRHAPLFIPAASFESSRSSDLKA